MPPSTDEYLLRTQRISTRLFIVLLILSLAVLLTYTAAVTVLKIFVIANPSFEQYKQLYGRYSSTMTCPCRHVSIPYKSFVSINYTLHEVCKSVYVTKEWINSIELPVDEFSTSMDPRMVALNTFRTLSSLCASIEELIVVNVLELMSSAYLSDVVEPEETFQSQATGSIEKFISSTIKFFVLSSELMNNAAKSDTLLIGTRAQYLLKIPFDSNTTNFDIKQYKSDCKCDFNIDCSVPPTTTGGISLPNARFVPGFLFGCFVFDAFRMSTLECLYSPMCVLDILKLTKNSTPLAVTALKSSNSTIFLPNATIGSILDQLMVEQWSNWTSHEDYYTACEPLQCQYTLKTKNDVIHIVATFIGLIGGLVTILRFVVHGLVSLIRERLRRTRLSSGKYSRRVR